MRVYGYVVVEIVTWREAVLLSDTCWSYGMVVYDITYGHVCHVLLQDLMGWQVQLVYQASVLVHLLEEC